MVMPKTICIEPVGEIPPERPVYDYDELPEGFQQTLVERVAAGNCQLQATTETPEDGSIVRFTSYYRISR